MWKKTPMLTLHPFSGTYMYVWYMYIRTYTYVPLIKPLRWLCRSWCCDMCIFYVYMYVYVHTLYVKMYVHLSFFFYYSLHVGSVLCIIIRTYVFLCTYMYIHLHTCTRIITCIEHYSAQKKELKWKKTHTNTREYTIPPHTQQPQWFRNYTTLLTASLA